MQRDLAPAHFDISNDYDPVYLTWRERGATGFENEDTMKNVFV